MAAKKVSDIENKDLVDLEECAKRLQDLWKLPKPPYARRTLLNKISNNEFKRYGPRKHVLLDWDEVKTKELKKRGG